MLNPDHIKHLGPAIGALRMRTLKAKSTVANAAGIRAAKVTAFERGEETPSLEVLFRYLSALGADLRMLQDALDWVRTGEKSTLFDTLPVRGRGIHFISAFRYLLRPIVEEILEDQEPSQPEPTEGSPHDNLRTQ